MIDDPYTLASRLVDLDDVDNVQADTRKVRIAHVPDDQHATSIPEDLFDVIVDAIDGTVWTWETGDPTPSTVERHSVIGGVHSHAIARGNPELQVVLVR